jgi:hypothetical protein
MSRIGLRPGGTARADFGQQRRGLRPPTYSRSHAATLLLTTLLLARARPAQPEPRRRGEAVLDRQAACWNRGDLRGFVGSYAEDTTFLGANGLVRGATDLLAKYERGYPDAESRGTLTFEVARGPADRRRPRGS